MEWREWREGAEERDKEGWIARWKEVDPTLTSYINPPPHFHHHHYYQITTIVVIIYYQDHDNPFTSKMVHLAQVKKDDSTLNLNSLQLQDDAHHPEDPSCVYGSRFALQQLPASEMPEGEMPREVAYRMIKDDLSLDGNPMLK